MWFALKKKEVKALSSGKPARGDLPAIGGSAMPGRATSGILLCKMRTTSLSIGWCTISLGGGWFVEGTYD